MFTKAECWGLNAKGQTDIPAGVKNKMHTLEAGGNHTCALDLSQQLVCWGSNNNGQTKVPRAVQGDLFMYALGESHSCATNNEGVVKCWGDKEYGKCDANA